jgi:hypothetical protein
MAGPVQGVHFKVSVAVAIASILLGVALQRIQFTEAVTIRQSPHAHMCCISFN